MKSKHLQLKGSAAQLFKIKFQGILKKKKKVDIR